MAHLNFDNDKEVLEVTIAGVVHKLEYPTWEQVEEIEKQALEGEQMETGRKTIQFLVDRGLPEVNLKKMKAHQIRTLFGELMGGNEK